MDKINCSVKYVGNNGNFFSKFMAKPHRYNTSMEIIILRTSSLDRQPNLKYPHKTMNTIFLKGIQQKNVDNQ